MVQKTEKIWLDGKMVNWDEAQVHVLTHTLHYGLGVFEGIRAYQCENNQSSVFRLKEHIDRLFTSGEMSLIKIPFSKEELVQACKDIFTVNKLKEGYLRPIAFIGDGEMGLHAIHNKIRVVIMAWPWGTYLGEEGVKNGIRARISTIKRLEDGSHMTESKTCGNYIKSILAKREALTSGFEEALMLDGNDCLAEASGENIFIVKKGKVLTPKTGVILKGITRDSIITGLKDQKIPVEEANISKKEAHSADEMFLTGTAAEITPIRELDGKPIGTGKPGPITQQIQKWYFDVIRGKNKKYEGWLNYLNK